MSSATATHPGSQAISDGVDQLRRNGFAIIDGAQTEVALVDAIGSEVAREDLALLRAGFATFPKDPYSPGNRRRGYAQVQIADPGSDFEFGIFEPYLQTKAYNPDTGGIVREYPLIDAALQANSILRQLILRDIDFVSRYAELGDVSSLMIGTHLFRYEAYADDPAFSSPSWLHRDDEDVVFVHLIARSSDLVGGDNVIATSVRNIEAVHPLTRLFDTLVTNHDKLHAVTPVGSSSSSVIAPAIRDIILVTFQKRLP